MSVTFLYPSTFEIGDFVFRIKQKTLSMLSSAISPAEHCKDKVFCLNVTLLLSIYFFKDKENNVFGTVKLEKYH